MTNPLDTVVNIGSAAGTPVGDKDYAIPFNLTGKINKLVIALEPPQLTPEDVKKLREAEARWSPTSSRSKLDRLGAARPRALGNHMDNTANPMRQLTTACSGRRSAPPLMLSVCAGHGALLRR